MLPALSPIEDWPQGVPYTVVLDPVFQFLVEGGLEKEKCHAIKVSPQLQASNVYSWIPKNQLLWIVPGTLQYLENFSHCTLKKAKGFKELQTRVTDERDEGQCIVAVEWGNWYLGYDEGELHYQWKERQ
ncbi:hypothetical protein DER46DRAFT_604868 [Fusarium sp. MPI-SDFR-AT-0072]|nr:hypothetical protein DER46DRAFT_604868 [Fusarium sp. MPI-SDFR-AT-0072]